MVNWQYKIRCAAIILISAGYGWAGGHYIPVNAPPVAYLFQFVILVLLLLLGINFLSQSRSDQQKKNRTVQALTIFSSVSLFMNVLNIIHGALTSGQSSFGSHNTPSDLVPVIMIITGTTSWLITLNHKKTARTING